MSRFRGDSEDRRGVRRGRDEEGEPMGLAWAREVQRAHKGKGKVVGPPATSMPAEVAVRPAAAGEPLFEGVMSAPITLYLPNGEVNVGAIPEYAAALRSDGVSGVFVNGTTGEGSSLSVQERKALTAAWQSTGLPVCAHIGAATLPDTIELAVHCQQIGVRAAAVMPLSSCILRPTSPEQIVDFLAEIAAAAPRLNLMLYHFPMITGISFPLHTILTSALEKGTVPTLRGAKFTSNDLADYTACKSIGGRITDVIFSWEPSGVAAAFLGCKCFIGMWFNTIAPLFVKLAAAGSKGDAEGARKYQKHLSEYLRMIAQAAGTGWEKNVAICKYLTGLRLGMDAGPVRHPGPRLSVIETQRLQKGMESFVASYTSSNKPAAAAAATAVNVHVMPGFTGELNAHIKSRVQFCSDKVEQSIAHHFRHLDKHPSKWQELPASNSVNISQFIDHTILKTEATAAEIAKLCDEAIEHKFFAVCVNGSRAPQCLSALRGTGVAVAAVIGFPLGAMTTKAKCREAAELAKKGCKEIDMVMNVGALKDGNYAFVLDDIAAVVEASAPAIVKVIFETCLLSRDEIIDSSILSVAAGAQFVKTSTGFNKGGATPEAIDCMLATVGPKALVKASGGVRDAPAAMAYITAGVSRIGTSSGIAIIKGSKSAGGY